MSSESLKRFLKLYNHFHTLIAFRILRTILRQCLTTFNSINNNYINENCFLKQFEATIILLKILETIFSMIEKMIPPIFSRKCLPINLHRIKPALNVQPITPWTRRKFISRRQRRFQKSIWTLDAFRWKLIIDRRRASTRRSPQPWPRIPRNGGGWDPRRNGERTGENARFHSHWLAKMRVRGSHVRWNVYGRGAQVVGLRVHSCRMGMHLRLARFFFTRAVEQTHRMFQDWRIRAGKRFFKSESRKKDFSFSISLRLGF